MGSHRFDAGVYSRRIAAATAAAAEAGLAGLVITPGYDLRYLLGSRAQTFERLTALVLPVSGDPTVVVPRLELSSLKQSAVADLIGSTATTRTNWSPQPWAVLPRRLP
jgi:Xaa-Pro aminopeptidase